VLHFLSELEVLHGKGGTTEQQFEATDKVSVIKSLWHHQASNPRALKLMAHLCVHYGIGSTQIWTNILTKMVHLAMVIFPDRLVSFAT
jgi:Rough deal protein C-terminal region